MKGGVQMMEIEIKRIYDEYGNHLLRTCFMYLGDKALAEDAMQDTMIKIYKNYNNFREESLEKTWITRIAINVCKDYLKSSWFKRVDVVSNLLDIEVADEATMEEDDSLMEKILKLPLKYKEILLLYYYDDYSIQEISDMLEVSVSNVTTRLNRARKKLKIQLEGEKRWEII